LFDEYFFFELIVTMVSCCIPMDFLYQFSYGVLSWSWFKKKLVQEEADLSTCSCRMRLHGVVYLIHPENLADPTFLGVTLTTGKICLTSIVQIAWRLYNIVPYETINEFYFSEKLSMTETVYIYNHWTTGWSYKIKLCRSKAQNGYHHTT
jgi:hypothetical protein